MQVTHVLATRVSTDTLAGLPGMLLSQVEPGADYGKAGGAQVAASVTGTDRQASSLAMAASQCTPACLCRSVAHCCNTAFNKASNNGFVTQQLR